MKKEITPKDSRYIPFTQQHSCCVPTCILMIMYKHGIPLIPQELLGHHLGLIVEEENKNLFWHVRTGVRPERGWGTQMYREEYEPNTVFSKLGIPLHVISRSVSSFDNNGFRKFLIDVVEQDRDVLVNFDHTHLNKKKGSRQGHVCILDRVYPDKNQVRLIDPSSKQPKWRIVNIDELKEAMEAHEGFFFEFELKRRITKINKRYEKEEK